MPEETNYRGESKPSTIPPGAPMASVVGGGLRCSSEQHTRLAGESLKQANASRNEGKGNGGKR